MRGNLLVTYSRPPYPPEPGDDAWPEASQAGGGKPTFQCVGGFWARDAGCWRGTAESTAGLDVVAGFAGLPGDGQTPARRPVGLVRSSNHPRLAVGRCRRSAAARSARPTTRWTLFRSWRELSSSPQLESSVVWSPFTIPPPPLVLW